MRDYVRWHDSYDDPQSSLSLRLREVQVQLSAALAARPGPVRVLSACSGEGRDVVGVLRDMPDAARVTATLVEIHPEIAETARSAARGLPVTVRTADAGLSDSYVDAVPADVVLLVGIFGNISDEDLLRTIAAAPQLCAAGATVLWSRSADGGEHNEFIRSGFAAGGFEEVAYREFGAEASRPALGVVQMRCEPQPLSRGQRWFTFTR